MSDLATDDGGRRCDLSCPHVDHQIGRWPEWSSEWIALWTLKSVQEIETRLARIEAEIETYRYLLPDPDSITGRALAGKARRAQRRQGG